MNSELARPSDVQVAEKVLESIVLRGDLSGLGPKERARFYVQVCEEYGLNPSSQPFAFLRLNGKEVLYATRGATDQLAAIHKLNREIIDGPKMIDLAGTKLIYAVCRVTHPNGRIETATATVPFVDPVNVLMKAETKAKRRATLSILGMGTLDEMELETIPASAQQPAPQVSRADLEQAQGDRTGEAGSHSPTTPPPSAELPPVPEGFAARVAEIELPGESVAVWMKHRGELANLTGDVREAAWRLLCAKTEEVGKMKNAKVWLKKAIAEEDARRDAHTHGEPGEDLPRSDEEGPPPGSAEEEEAAEQEPPSAAFATFHTTIAAVTTLVAARNAYLKLIEDLQGEKLDPEPYTSGDNGAWSMVATKTRDLGHKLVKAEISQVIAAKGLAEILDTQVDIKPCADALKLAAEWWIRHRDAVKALDPAHRNAPWYALVRRYSDARDAVATKKAGTMLDAAVKAKDSKNPPPSGGPGGGAPRPTQGTNIHVVGSSQPLASSGDVPPAALAEFRVHLAGLPDRGRDRGAGRMAGAYWKRREDFISEGTNAEALGLVLDALDALGVAESHAWLQEIGEKNGYLTRRVAA